MDLETYQLRQLAAVAPAGYTTEDAARDLAKLATRPEVLRPFSLLIAALRSGQPIYDQAELEAELARLGGKLPRSSAVEHCPRCGRRRVPAGA